MTRWMVFVVKTIIVCAVLVGIAGGAAVAGLFAVSAVSGLGPKAVMESALAKLQGMVGSGDDKLGNVTANLVSQRGEFSTAFQALESRVERLERKSGIAVPLRQSQKASGFAGTPLALPPVGNSPPPVRFGGAVAETDLVLEPLSSVPKFDYSPPAKADVCLESCQFNNLAAAYKAAKPNSSITLAPGYYPECLVVKKSVLIVGQIGPNGERAQFDSQCSGKAAFVISARQFELRGVLIRDIKVRDRNGACLRVEPKTVTFRVNNIICQNSENGIIGSAAGAVFVDSSLFSGAGAGGRAHGIYINSAKELIIRNTIFHSTKGQGHTVKSGAARTIIQNSVLAALNGENSRALDFYGDGTLIVTGSVLQQGPNSENHDLIALARESRRVNLSAEHIALFENNLFIFDHKPSRCCRWLATGRALGPVIFRNNRLVSINDHKFEGLKMENNQEFATRSDAGLPEYNGELNSIPMPTAWNQ